MADRSPEFNPHHDVIAPAPVSDEAEADARHRISLIKGEERWYFRWDPGDESLLINCIAQMARDPNVPFDWFDAAVICKHVAQPFGSSGPHKRSK